MEVVMERAEKWAAESGFVAPVEVSVPEVEKYPKRGHGYVVQVREKTGRERKATAHFTAGGDPSLWTLDGRVV